MSIEKEPVIFTTLAYAVLNKVARGETNESCGQKFDFKILKFFSEEN